MLGNTQLCKFFLKRKGCNKLPCNFAHSLQALKPIPAGFDNVEGHYWQGHGDQKSNEALDLLRTYSAHGETPEWVVNCLSYHAPKRKMPTTWKEQVEAAANRQNHEAASSSHIDEASSLPALPPSPSLITKRSAGSDEEAPAPASPRSSLEQAQINLVASLEQAQINLMVAILGWRDCSAHNTIGHLTLHGIRVLLRLSPWDDVQVTKDLSAWDISVQ